MKKISLSLSPVDAWFFRDARPYNKGESNLAGVKSIFPPNAPTVVGALRAALARQHGWSGRGGWEKSLCDLLGDGFDDLGALDFNGPYLMRAEPAISPGEPTIHLPLYPAPLNLLGRHHADEQHTSHWRPETLLRPGSPVQCDLSPRWGEGVRLPEPEQPSDGLKDAAGLWITRKGLSKLLSGALPAAEDIISSEQLWRWEPRIGLVRDDDSLTTADAALYSPSYIRLLPHTSLGIQLQNGSATELKLPGQMPLGGEARRAYVQTERATEQIDLTTPALPEALKYAKNSDQLLNFSALFITPARFNAPLRPNRPLPAEFGQLSGCTLVSACVGKAEFVGGWNSLAREPLPLQAFLPAGTTLFLQADPAQVDLAHLLSVHGQKIGARRAYGYGQCLFGVW